MPLPPFFNNASGHCHLLYAHLNKRAAAHAASHLAEASHDLPQPVPQIAHHCRSLFTQCLATEFSPHVPASRLCCAGPTR